MEKQINKIIKLKDVANKAKVSLATASLAFNNSPLVKDETKKKVMLVAKKLKYYPNISAQRLAKGQSFHIGLMLNSNYFFKAPNTYYLRVIGGIIKNSINKDYSIDFLFYNNLEEFKKSKYSNNFFNRKNLNGLIVLDIIEEDLLNNILSVADIPILLLDNHKKYSNVFSVDNDDFGGTYKAIKYLINLNHEKIGYIGLPDSHPLGLECWRGFKRAMDERNLKAHLVYKNCGLGIKSGRVAINSVLSSEKPLPTAFFCVNDYIAIGVIEELKKNGFKVPEQFSIIGMDDMELSSEIEPALTTVRIEMEKLGHVGIEKLFSILNGDYSIDVKTIIDNKIIVRNSCTTI